VLLFGAVTTPIKVTTFHQSVHHVSLIEFPMRIANRAKHIELKAP
jgi:hypothetical protein